MVKAAKGNRLKGILAVSDEPLVSSDFNHSPASSTFDLTQTQVLDDTFVRILTWYDNEWGFSNRMSDTAVALGKLIRSEEHTYELQSLMRISYAVFCLKKKKKNNN